MIYWAPFLHFYQPPTQFHAVLKKICNESYRPLVKLFQSHPEAKVTINISGVLTELLMDHGAEDIVFSMQELGERGQLEFVGTSKYHAILPLIPRDEASRQIELNRKTNSFFFKDAFRPKGFFPPEMCYSREIIPPIVEAGHSWMILSGVACSAPWPMDKIYGIESEGFKMSVLFRDDILSNKISFHGVDSKGFISHLQGLYRGQVAMKRGSGAEKKEHDIYVITAMDAETFGHHIQNWEKLFLQEVYEAVAVTDKTYKDLKQRRDLAKDHKELLDASAEQVKVVSLSELLDLFPQADAIEPFQSSWSSSAEDLRHQNFYPLWRDPGNQVHKLLWEHLDICLDLVKKAMFIVKANQQSKPYADMARGLLDRAEYSCQWWWASRRPMWDINLINKGLASQEEVIFNAYRALSMSSMPDNDKKSYYYKVVAAENIANKIRDILFHS